MSDGPILNRPHALYYNGELIGIITNPDPYPGGIADICDQLSPNEGLADAVTIPQNMGNLEAWAEFARSVTVLEIQAEIDIDEDDDDDWD